VINLKVPIVCNVVNLVVVWRSGDGCNIENEMILLASKVKNTASWELNSWTLFALVLFQDVVK
jgi:hypothetical protein